LIDTALDEAAQGSLVDRAVRLFAFLGRAQQLKNQSATALDSYRREGAVHWLHELPVHPALDTALRGGTPGWSDPVLAKRMSTAELAQLLTVETDELTHEPFAADGQRDEKFLAQLHEFQTPEVANGVRQVLTRWTEVSGHLHYGLGDVTSCSLMSTNAGSHPDIWPLTVYPSGRCEVVFQRLARRAPFDDPALREQLRQRLNTVAGIDLPAAKIELRPSFPLDVLESPANRDALVEHLAWFREVVTS
jgi:hypothetical protein